MAVTGVSCFCWSLSLRYSSRTVFICSGPVLGCHGISTLGTRVPTEPRHSQSRNTVLDLLVFCFARPSDGDRPPSRTFREFCTQSPRFCHVQSCGKTDMFHIPLTSGSHSFKACVLVAFTSVSSSLLDSAFIVPPSEGCGGLSGIGSSSGRLGRVGPSSRSDSDLPLRSPVLVTGRVSFHIIGVFVRRGLEWS